MRHYLAVRITTILLVIATCTGASAQNLLKNPGFEDPAGWLTNWIIRDAKGGNLTLSYHLTAQGGGHGDATPRTGKNAVEIYTCGIETYLAQKVRLDPGTYRLSAWVRGNGMPNYAQIEIRLGDQKSGVTIISEKYRLIWADFKIDTAGEYDASIYCPVYGMAVDDLSLEKITDNTPKGPALYIELHPSNKDRANGIQHCLKGSLQWVHFVTICADPVRIKRPVMRILASDPVKLSGINEELINSYRMREEDQVKVQSRSVVRDGRKYQEFSFLFPKFIQGYARPLDFGGFWVSDVPAKGGKVIMEIVDGEEILAREEVKLVAIDPPKVSKTPKKYYTFSYCVQDNEQSLEARMQALPAQFKMIGFNVWSDHGLVPESSAKNYDYGSMVRNKAYTEYGIRDFWPNFHVIVQTSSNANFSDLSGKYGDKDMYAVNTEGAVDRYWYNFNYAANKGRAWADSALAAWTRTVKRPIEQSLPAKYTGLVNDGLEGMHSSYDPSTLAAFAVFKGVDVSQVTIDKLSGEWKKDWQLFNMDLYTRVVDIWAEQARQVDPNVKIVNTAGTYGPGGFGDLSTAESMKWARSVDYNMPQWYAGHYYGSGYTDLIKQGEAAGVFGKENGGVDLIPLLNLSMGSYTEDPATLRFQMLDYFSYSKSVKGVGYYVGTYAFADAKCIVGLSKNHTLIAEIEDYYADGVRDDNLVKVTQLPTDVPLLPGMDLEGKQIMVRPKPSSDVRVHKLNKDGRIDLITVISYNDQGKPGIGDRISLEINKKMLPQGGKNMVLINRLTGKKQPLPDKITVDTKKTNNVAVYEIAEK